MLCPSCQSRNSPAALACHNCGVPFDRAHQRSESGVIVTALGVRGTALRITGFGILAALLLLAWPLGTWMGRRSLEARTNDPMFISLSARYNLWKQAHGLDENVLMECYARDALIIRETGQRESYNDLLQLARTVRKGRIFSEVQDLESPQIVITGSRAEIRARHCYRHSGGTMSPLAGDRRLTWEKRKGRWLIVEDHFPTSYVPVK